jgi:hypothetical protein
MYNKLGNFPSKLYGFDKIFVASSFWYCSFIQYLLSYVLLNILGLSKKILTDGKQSSNQAVRPLILLAVMYILYTFCVMCVKSWLKIACIESRGRRAPKLLGEASLVEFWTWVIFWLCLHAHGGGFQMGWVLHWETRILFNMRAWLHGVELFLKFCVDINGSKIIL